MALSDHFKDHTINVKSHIGGYVSEYDVDKTAIGAEYVTDCNNMDFLTDYDRRRNPIDIYTDLATETEFPTGYTIDNIVEKKFFDASGNEKDMFIAVLTKSGSPTKIFTKGYYCPQTTAENDYGVTTKGFNTEWTEITERYKGTDTDFEAGSWVFGGITHNLRSDDATIFAKPLSYCKGWFVINSDRVVGIITNSYKESFQATKTYSAGHTGWCTVNSFTGTSVTEYKIKLTSYAASGANYDYVFSWTKDNWTNSYTLHSGTTSGGGLAFTESFDDDKIDVTVIDVSGWALNDEVEIDIEAVTYTYFACDIEAGQTLGTSSGICRFPVNQFNNANWANYTNTVIDSSFPNAVRIFAEDQRPLWLGFIREREYLTSYSGVTTYPGSPTGWLSFTNTLWNKNVADVITITLTKSVGASMTTFVLTATDTGGYVNCSDTSQYPNATTEYFRSMDLNGAYGYTGLSILVVIDVADIVDTETAVYTITKSTNSKIWDGFWFGYDAPEVINKKTPTVFNSSYPPSPEDGDGDLDESISIAFSNELGMSYMASRTGQLTSQTKTYSLYAMAMELDGYQTLYSKHIIGNDKYHVDKLTARFEKWFDRRITALLLFHNQTDTSYTIAGNSEVDDTYLVASAKNGYVRIGDLGVTEHADNFDYATIYDNISGGSDTKSDIMDYATGLSLNNYLNHYYWKSLQVKPKGAVRVGENLLYYNISPESMALDKDSKGNVTGIGKTAVALSNVQNGGLNTPSIVPTERIRELTRDEILGASNIYGQSFLLFTPTEVKWYEIDDTSYIYRNIGNFQSKGCLSASSIVEATTHEVAPTGTASEEFGARQFNGIFWAGYDSIYGFFQNEPIDLLENRWKKEYQALVNTAGFTIKGFYNAYAKEIWFYLKNTGSTVNCFYIYSIAGKHWKKYTLPTGVVPDGLFMELTGLLYFWDGAKVYRTEPEGTSKYQDTSSSSASAISFGYTSYLNHGSSNMLKVADRIDMMYDVSVTETSEQFDEATLDVNLYSNARELEILDKTIVLQHVAASSATNKRYKFRQGVAFRTPNNYVKLVIASNTTKNKIQKIKFTQLTINSKLTRGTLSKN